MFFGRFVNAISPFTRAAELQEIATASGGRMCSPESTYGLSGIHDDLMENLRARYVTTYKSSAPADLVTARNGPH
jgi:hypothetical protein